jgi:hypothetical protein
VDFGTDSTELKGLDNTDKTISSATNRLTRQAYLSNQPASGILIIFSSLSEQIVAGMELHPCFT